MKTITGDAVAALLEAAGTTVAFGVISIHNMPILDAFARRGNFRFVPARSEAGAVNMADGWARASDRLGIAVTSTGTGAGNAAGAMVEARTAGTPLLHITGQVEVSHLDRNRGVLHEAPDQLAMLRSVSKVAYRVWSPEFVPGVLYTAIRDALTPPRGPVSVEIPIDVQKASCTVPAATLPMAATPPAAEPSALDELAAMSLRARRPLLWLGGGARHAGVPVHSLADMGFGVVTSVAGRGILPEDHPMSLGAFNLGVEVEQFYRTCDLLIVAGSRLRSNETRTYSVQLPRPRVQIDIDLLAWNRGYSVDLFACGDAETILTSLSDRLEGRFDADPAFRHDLAATRTASERALRQRIGPYSDIADSLRATMPRDALWVRDVTIANSTWGNRLLPLYNPRQGIHALGGGIGQGLQMAIGASLGAPGRKVVALVGDGGLMLNVGELATAVQERADVTIVVMNDRGYGVIRNIQDVQYGGRRCFADLHTPDFVALGEAIGIPTWKVGSVGAFAEAIRQAISTSGPALVEVDMEKIGPYPVPFAGPPVPEKA